MEKIIPFSNSPYKQRASHVYTAWASLFSLPFPLHQFISIPFFQNPTLPSLSISFPLSLNPQFLLPSLFPPLLSSILIHNLKFLLPLSLFFIFLLPLNFPSPLILLRFLPAFLLYVPFSSIYFLSSLACLLPKYLLAVASRISPNLSKALQSSPKLSVPFWVLTHLPPPSRGASG